MSGISGKNYIAICGGVGGAKLTLGLEKTLGQNSTVIVNTGDDFEHLGLSISPDIDTVLYTLSGKSDEVRGWGRAGETWAFMGALAEVGGETWFQLGDKDLALHVERSRRLADGELLTRITADIAARFGIRSKILPMSDDRLRTVIETDRGILPFQRYFVEHRCAPVVRQIGFSGAEAAEPSGEVLAAFADPQLSGVIICPSNPYLSIAPILAIPGLAASLRHISVPVIAISPLIGGAAVKGPTAKIMQELGLTPTSAAIAEQYQNIIDGFVLDERDSAEAERIALPVLTINTLMNTLDDRMRLARESISFIEKLAAARG